MNVHEVTRPVAGPYAVLDCTDPIASMDIAEVEASRAPYEIVADAVALPTSDVSEHALEVSDGGRGGFALFAKVGLLVRVGVESRIVVPTSWDGEAALAWGNTGTRNPSPVFEIPACEGPDEWIAFPGGFHLDEPACVPLVVESGGIEVDVTVGVGAPCPGQEPPNDNAFEPAASDE